MTKPAQARARSPGAACRHPAATETTDKSRTIAGESSMLERISAKQLNIECR
jgi:hypothetical protein